MGRLGDCGLYVHYRSTYLGVNLRRPLQQAVDAHVRRGAAKQPAEPRRGEEDEQRRVRVGADRHDAVAPAHAARLHGRRQPSRVVPQLAPGHVARLAAALADLGQRDLVVFLVLCAARPGAVLPAALVEVVFGKVEPHALEPARQAVDGDRLVHDPRVAALVDGALRVPDGAPKVGAFLAGPGAQLVKALVITAGV